MKNDKNPYEQITDDEYNRFTSDNYIGYILIVILALIFCLVFFWAFGL